MRYFSKMLALSFIFSLWVLLFVSQLLFETIIDHIANFTATSQTFEMVKVRSRSNLINMKQQFD